MAISALERIEAQRTSLGQRLEDLESVRTAARQSIAEAEQALNSLADPDLLETELENARIKASDAAAKVADTRALFATRARESASDRERLTAAARAVREWEQRRENAEKRLSQNLERRAEQERERSELEKEPAQLQSAIVELERANDESQIRLGEAGADERAAEETLVELPNP